MKEWHDRQMRRIQFTVGGLALLFDSKYQDFMGKLQTRWMGPYKILQFFDNGTFQLEPIDGSRRLMLVNEHRLCPYTFPLNEEDFTRTLRQANLCLIEGDLSSLV